MAGGYTTTNISSTEEYDGTNWSNGNAMPYSRANITIAGTQTAAILAAGSPASPTATLEYDGTNWTATAAYLLCLYILWEVQGYKQLFFWWFFSSSIINNCCL